MGSLLESFQSTVLSTRPLLASKQEPLADWIISKLPSFFLQQQANSLPPPPSFPPSTQYNPAFAQSNMQHNSMLVYSEASPIYLMGLTPGKVHRRAAFILGAFLLACIVFFLLHPLASLLFIRSCLII